VDNLLTGLPARLPAERVDVLLEAGGVRLERIVSTGHATAPGQWYDQDTEEWVAVLAGRALLRFEDEAAAVAMAPGDHLTIAAHRRHRVEWTSPDEPTVWLALHVRRRAPGGVG
jgi:cupin 2 domain-containing protein